jgi:hypothetical protein
LCLAYNTAAIELLGKPAVMICNQSFVHDAQNGGAARDLPGLRVVGTTIPQGTHEEAEVIRKGVPADKIIEALTAPLTEEEKNPPVKDTAIPARISFKGSIEDVNKFFYRRGWSGGLPVLPPTEGAVKEMLQGTDLPANHVVAKLPPRMGNATVEKIAVNAVMAGALPIHMPVLIAGVKALADHWEWVHAAATLISVAPCWVINGPIRNDIFVNSGRSLVSSGILANTAIPRAIQLITRNIAGVYRPGIDTLSWYGHEGMASMCLAEK